MGRRQERRKPPEAPDQFSDRRIGIQRSLSSQPSRPIPNRATPRTIGEVRNVVIIVIHTEPEPDYSRGEAVGRIISARKAESRERNAYEAGEF